MNNLITIAELIALIGKDKPCIFNAPRGEVIMLCTGEKTINAHKYYELTTPLENGRTLSSWYWELDQLRDFNLIDYIE